MLRNYCGMQWLPRRSISSNIIVPSSATDRLLSLPLLEDEVKSVEKLLCYRFRNRALLEEALVHPSYSTRRLSSLVHPFCRCVHSSLLHTSCYKYRQSYKKLKIVGMRTLSEDLYRDLWAVTRPMDRRILSLRAVLDANISNQKLARTAVRLGLYSFLRRDSPKLDQQVDEFIQIDKGEIGFGGSVNKAPKVLADIVMSIYGAIYEDSGHQEEYTLKKMEEHLSPIITSEDLDYLSLWHLSSLCQERGMTLEFKNRKFETHVRKFQRMGKEGRLPAKVDINLTRVYINGKHFGSGSSESEYIAKYYAATEALWNLPNYMILDCY